MADYDIIIKNGTVVTAADRVACDVGIKGEKVAALGTLDGSADRVIDAADKLVLPGGVEGHCHIEQLSSCITHSFLPSITKFFERFHSCITQGFLPVFSK